MIFTLDRKVDLFNDFKKTIEKIDEIYSDSKLHSDDYMERMEYARDYNIDSYVSYLATMMEDIASLDERVKRGSWTGKLLTQLFDFNSWINDTLDKWQFTPLKSVNSDMMLDIDRCLEAMNKIGD